MPNHLHGMEIFPYTLKPSGSIKQGNHVVSIFDEGKGHGNIDKAVVDSFGEEWSTFHHFEEDEIAKIGSEYFDIVSSEIVSPESKVLDVGCGSGRWSKYLLDHYKAQHIDAIDPSDAIFVASKILENYPNVRLSKCSADTLPFPDNSFDFVMSVGVLHHLPDTAKAIQSCVQKIKPDGYLYLYLYYNLDNRGYGYKALFQLVTGLRRIISALPNPLKKASCEILALLAYAPLVYLGKGLRKLGGKGLAEKLPLSYYQNKSYYIIRNDALDRFGTKIEHRFSRKQIQAMLQNTGLANIRFSDHEPFWHVLAQKI